MVVAGGQMFPHPGPKACAGRAKSRALLSTCEVSWWTVVGCGGHQRHGESLEPSSLGLWVLSSFADDTRSAGDAFTGSWFWGQG